MANYNRPPRRKQSKNTGVAVANLLIASILFFSLVGILGSFGQVVRNILFGIFGISAYAFSLFFIIISSYKLFNHRVRIDKRKAARYLPLLIIGILAVHTITTRNYIVNGYGDYLKQCYQNGISNGGGLVFGAISYLITGWAGYNFAMALFVILFFSVAFISLYPLFLNSGNIKAKSIKYNKKSKNSLYRVEEEEEPNNIEVGSELFIGSPDGKSDNNKIHRKSSFSSKTREFDILFPNKQDLDAETSEDNSLIDRIKNKGSYDILFSDPFSKSQPEIDDTVVKVKKSQDAPPSLIFPTATAEPAETKFVNKPKPVVQPADKYANYTLGYKQAQIKKSIDDGVQIDTKSKKRLGIFEETDKKDYSEKAQFDTIEEKERFETAKSRLYGEENYVKEPDKTFESLFNSNKTNDFVRKSTIFDNLTSEKSAEDKNSSYDILYGNKTEEAKLPDHNLDRNLFGKKRDFNQIGFNDTNDNVHKEDAITQPKTPKDVMNSLPDLVIKDIPNYSNREDGEMFNDLPKDASSRALRSDIGKSHNVVPKAEKSIMDIKIDPKQVSIVDSPTAVYKKSRYIAPPDDLLKIYPKVASESSDEHQERCIDLRNVLLEYDIDTSVDTYTVGPSFTRYEITMPIGVTVKKIQQISEDITMRLKAKKIRIEAPIPGKNAVGVEVANSRPSTVGLREGIRSLAFKKESELSFLLGVNISNEVYTCNIVKMPHLLIAGATGSGKSVCINTLICSLLYKYSPDQVRLILIDPKRVELSLYNNLPHLLIPDVIYDADKAMNAMNWAIKEMERRFECFRKMRVRNLDEHNKKAESEGMPSLPYLVIIIDELADLMTVKKRDIEEKIKRLAQLARAAGIHLIFATQRPSVDIITGTIKANFPSRIAFYVTSFADSKTILDHGGADKLRGQGDMLYTPCGSPEPIRLQGAFISNEEVEAITDFIRDNNTAYYDESIEAEINAVKPIKGDELSDSEYSSDNDNDEYFLPALKMIIEANQASISMLQRRFSIGYARAARLIDEMEAKGYIGMQDGSKPREVKLTMVEYNKLYGGEN